MRQKGRDRLPAHLRATPPGVRAGSCASLWGRHAGEDAWVVGTGTSVAGFDFSRLAGRLTIALNDAILAPLDPAYHLFHDHGLWRRYSDLDLHPRTTVICSDHSFKAFSKHERCRFKARVLFFSHAGSPRDVTPEDHSLYVDRTVATAGIQLAWKLGARRVFLLGVDGYKLRAADGSERYYGAPVSPEAAASKATERRDKKRERRESEGRIVQDRHAKWIENMAELRRAFLVRKVFPCVWPGPGVYNLSELSVIDAWPKITMDQAFGGGTNAGEDEGRRADRREDGREELRGPEARAPDTRAAEGA